MGVALYIEKYLGMESTEFHTWLVFCLILFVTWIAWKWLSKKKPRLPPGPIGMPIMGYWPFLSRNVAHKQLYEMRKKYGPVISMYWGSRLVVVLLDFPTLKEAFSKDSFLGRPPISAFTLFKDGISFNETSGQVWKVNRRFTMHVMRDLGFGKSAMQGHIQSEISELLSIFQDAKGEPTEIRMPLTSSVSNNVTALIFGRRLEFSDPLRNFLNHVVLLIMNFFKQTSVHAYFPFMTKLFVFFRLWKYDKAKDSMRQFYKFVDQEIAEHRKTLVEGHIRDYIDGYIQELDSKKVPDEGFTTSHLKGNIRSMFGAGSEATRTALEWCLMVMAENQDYQTKIQKEIDSVIGRDRMPTLDDIPRTPLTQATILEVLRWTGLLPLGIIRLVTKDDNLLGYDIPKDTLAVANIWGIHHDPELWSDPMTFRPERFITEDGKVVKPEYFIPFSYGRRSCPAESLAHTEMYLYFASILQKFQVLPPKDKTDLYEHELAITLQLLDTRLRFVDRYSSQS